MLRHDLGNSYRHQPTYWVGHDADLSLPSCWVGATSFLYHHRFWLTYAYYRLASQEQFSRQHMHHVFISISLNSMITFLAYILDILDQRVLPLTIRYDTDTSFMFPRSFDFAHRSRPPLNAFVTVHLYCTIIHIDYYQHRPKRPPYLCSDQLASSDIRSFANIHTVLGCFIFHPSWYTGYVVGLRYSCTCMLCI